MIALLLMLAGCLPRPVEWLPAPTPDAGSAMTLEPGSASGLLVGVVDVPDLDAPAEDTGEVPADTGSEDTGTVPADTGSEPVEDPGPDLSACDAAGYVTAATTASYSGGSGGLANLGTVSGVGYICDWSCSGDPWWVVLSVTTDGTCTTDAGAMPIDVGAAGSLELCARVYASGVSGGSYTTCTATYTGGSVDIEVSG